MSSLKKKVGVGGLFPGKGLKHALTKTTPPPPRGNRGSFVSSIGIGREENGVPALGSCDDPGALLCCSPRKLYRSIFFFF